MSKEKTYTQVMLTRSSEDGGRHQLVTHIDTTAAKTGVTLQLRNDLDTAWLPEVWRVTEIYTSKMTTDEMIAMRHRYAHWRAAVDI